MSNVINIFSKARSVSLSNLKLVHPSKYAHLLEILEECFNFTPNDEVHNTVEAIHEAIWSPAHNITGSDGVIAYCIEVQLLDASYQSQAVDTEYDDCDISIISFDALLSDYNKSDIQAPAQALVPVTLASAMRSYQIINS